MLNILESIAESYKRKLDSNTNTDFKVDDYLQIIINKVAEASHNAWRSQKISQGYVYGEKNDDEKKTSPYLIPFDQLPTDVKEENIKGAENSIKVLSDIGYSFLDRKVLVEQIASRVHDNWSRTKIAHGYSYGEVRDDALKHHPDLIPFQYLRENSKTYDYAFAEGLVDAIYSNGYVLVGSNSK